MSLRPAGRSARIEARFWHRLQLARRYHLWGSRCSSNGAGVLHSEERGFRFETAIEEKRVIGAAPDREVIEPCGSVIESPESHPGNRVAATQVDAEKIGIPPRQTPLHFFRQAIRVGVEWP